MITPQETISRLIGLKLTNQAFRKIHHFENETVGSHISYLNNCTKYQGIESNNHIVALRLQCLENFENQGLDRKNAIDSCIAGYPFK